jgi:spore coat polysaccharide biosynthesis protein SpsF
MTLNSGLYTVAIIQARMGSSRLPGKVLQDISGRPMLGWVVERTRRAGSVDLVVVATTSEPDDAPISEYCTAHSYPVYRGSLHDVLDRYYQAARQFGAQALVRITADCPLIDPSLIDRTVLGFLGQIHPEDQILGPSEEGGSTSEPPSARHGNCTEAPERPATVALQPGTAFDFVANRLPPPWGRTYPIGLDAEVCSFLALECAWREADLDYQREHVMPYLYDHRERFRCLLVNHTQDYGTLRWTVDTAEDLELLRQICARFPGRDDFSWLEVLELWQRQPQLAQINARIRHKIYSEVDGRRGNT